MSVFFGIPPDPTKMPLSQRQRREKERKALDQRKANIGAALMQRRKKKEEEEEGERWRRQRERDEEAERERRRKKLEEEEEEARRKKQQEEEEAKKKGKINEMSGRGKTLNRSMFNLQGGNFSGGTSKFFISFF